MIIQLKLSLILVLLLLAACEVDTSSNGDLLNKTLSFNAERASALGADSYGMRTYVLVMLSSGEAHITDEAELAQLQEQHMANIRRMAEKKHLVLAGPFFANEHYRGLFILATEDIDQAKEWVDTDPAIAAGLLQADYFPWYGSAALMEVSEIHKTIEQEQP